GLASGRNLSAGGGGGLADIERKLALELSVRVDAPARGLSESLPGRLRLEARRGAFEVGVGGGQRRPGVELHRLGFAPETILPAPAAPALARLPGAEAASRDVQLSHPAPGDRQGPGRRDLIHRAGGAGALDIRDLAGELRALALPRHQSRGGGGALPADAVPLFGRRIG